MPDRTAFFAAIRAPLFGGRLTPGQVDGLTRIMDDIDARPVTDLRWRAYMLATTFHETAATMQPIEEIGRGAGHPYANGGWWGRGLVQLTWPQNYAVWGKRLGVDLVGHPELAMTWPVALPVLVNGMALGLFTGVGLPRYFSAAADDPAGARRVINGVDRAEMIAGYHRAFLAALAGRPVAVQPTQLYGRPGFGAASQQSNSKASDDAAATAALNDASLARARA